MKILVINTGSSSLKYQLYDMRSGKVLAKGLCGRIGDGGELKHETHDGRKFSEKISMNDHSEAFDIIIGKLTIGDYAVIGDVSEVDAVGHRIVQGGDIFNAPVLVDQKVLDEIGRAHV